MKLITTATELEKEFRRLTQQYDHFYWATAWASSNSNLFNDLISNKDKIRKIVVGIHFYQTHPNFIKAFLNHKKVRFIQQPEGTFHPKLYLFTDNTGKWELLVGSANFTGEAFSRNTEVCLLMSHQDNNADDTYHKAIALVEQTFSEGKSFDKTELEQYQIVWENHRQKTKSLSGQYGNTNKKRRTTPIHEVSIITKSWEEFMETVSKELPQVFAKRLKVLEEAKVLFKKVNHFNNLTEDERKFIAGVPNKLRGSEDDVWQYFGSMKGAGTFKNRIKENDENISKALDQIPLSGQITKEQYNKFIAFYTRAFPLPSNYIATATRLLCMKRPDIFVCLDSKNRSALCKDFGIVQSEMNYDRYWDDIVERIYDSNWWQNPTPQNSKERNVSEARAAFLDSLYYEE